MTTPERCGTVAVIGNGLIGHGVAQVFATAGHDVRLIGRSRDSLDRALTRIRGSLGAFVRNRLVAASDVEGILVRIRVSTALDDAAGADLV
jgi:3-hydroxybutyryl-CoA dehydrogenase